VRQLTHDTLEQITPSWSPDERWIIYGMVIDGFPDIFVMPFAEDGTTGEPIRITQHPAVDTWATWMPK
jgi:Tol biopolymer transport system component